MRNHAVAHKKFHQVKNMNATTVPGERPDRIPYSTSIGEPFDSKENWNKLADQGGLIAAKGMLHQYSELQYTDISNHYSSPLNNCSYLLPQTCSESSKVPYKTDSFACDEDFHMKADKYQDDGFANQLQSTFDVQKLRSLDSAAAALLHASDSNLMDQNETKENLYNGSRQLIRNDEQNNNNVHKLETDHLTNGDLYQNEESYQQESSILSLPISDAETKPGVSVAEGFRLPGFHQAFGCTEIGRFVHQKDFIEQISQQSSSSSFVSLPQSSKPSLTMPPCLLSPSSNSINCGSSSPPKGRSRYNKRLKMPLHSRPPLPSLPAAPPPSPTAAGPAELSRNTTGWHYEYEGGGGSSTGNSSMNFQSTGSNYYKYRDTTTTNTRSKRHQYSESNSILPYCNSEEYYNCPSTSSYYYSGGGCSDNTNCDYYTRYHQQNSSQYHQNGYSVSAYSSSLYTGYSNGYHHYNKEHSRFHGINAASDMSCGGVNQNCQTERYFPYGEQQLPYHYDKQSSASSYHQYQPYMSPHSQHPSQQLYSNYNSYTPIPSYNYF